jgi:trans-AT polyketide synthase, acyltransferase and oxidoreductase domains
MNGRERIRIEPGPSWWAPHQPCRETGPEGLRRALHEVLLPFALLDLGDARHGLSHHGTMHVGVAADPAVAHPVSAFVPALPPWRLGDPQFLQRHGVRYPCVAGAMARGIASVEVVEAMARAGMLAFFGAGGLAPEQVETALQSLRRLGDLPFGVNLLHSPNEPGLEDRLVDMYLARGVRCICAAAYLTLTLPVVRFRFTGVHRDAAGGIVTPQRVFAKVSRAEVARKFLAPPSAAMLATLVEQGVLTSEQAEMASHLPVAEDVTAEADSGGHTDNRAALVLLPSICALRDEMQRVHAYNVAPRIGAAGGIATPASTAAAFAMGAAYVMTGSINQSCVEAGTSLAVREMLAHATQADVAMAPAADMFEMGVRVQVLKWGTMFAARARKLYELYQACDSVEQLPAAERTILERDFFRRTLEEEWASCARFFTDRDPAQLARAQRDPRHRLALLFRSYLGQASSWAQAGDPSRKADYQIWCGPAIGAFNEWVRGTFLEDLSERRVATVALNLVLGAAVVTRTMQLRQQGVSLPPSLMGYAPLRLEEIHTLLEWSPDDTSPTHETSRPPVLTGPAL